MSARRTWRAVAARAASILLRYPDAEILTALPTLRAALAGLPPKVAGPLGDVAAQLATRAPDEVAAHYVDLFDFRRRCCLYLTYYTHGDTRLRGGALADFAAAYRRAGLVVADGELPDYLPAVLDLAAVDDAGWALLRANRVGLSLLADALAKDRSVYRRAVDAVLASLPRAGRRERAAAARAARTGPPTELVGLEPFTAAPGVEVRR